MSLEYRRKFGDQKISKEEMREWCKRPGRVDDKGKPLYTTEQAHKDRCDVNKIIKRYDKDGLIRHVTRFEAKFGDLSGEDFKTMTDKVINAKNSFDKLPSEIRNRFNNDPGSLLEFMDNPENRNEAIKLGLIRKTWSEELDGLGEHVVRDENEKVVSVESTAKAVETEGK